MKDKIIEAGLADNRSSEIELFLSSVDSGAPLPDLPVKINPGNDLLGLVGHEDVRGGYTAVAFNNLDFIGSVIISSDSEKSRDMLDGKPVLLTRIQTSSIHSTDVTRVQRENGTVMYKVERVDKGIESGGFWFARQDNGTVLFKIAGLETFDTDSDEYLHALQQATRFINVIAEKVRIRHDRLPNNAVDFHTGEEFVEKIKKQHSFRHKIARNIGKLATGIKNNSLKLVTNYKEFDENNLPVHKRVVARKKIAALAMLVPVPFISGTFGDTNIPRPLGIAIVDGTIHKADNLFNGGDKEQARKAVATKQYDSEEIDLPDEAELELDGQSQPIVVISGKLDDRISDAPTLAVPNVLSGEEVAVDGESPRKLKLEGILDGGQCIKLEIAPKNQGDDISMLGRTSNDVSHLEVQASTDSIDICNAQDTTISLRDRNLLIDLQ